MCNVPCKNCEKRAIPKTCEKDCPLWIAYKEERNKQKQTEKENRRLHQRLNGAIWRNRK